MKPFKEFWFNKSVSVYCGKMLIILSCHKKKRWLFVTDSPHNKCIIKIKRNFIPWHLDGLILFLLCTFATILHFLYSHFIGGVAWDLPGGGAKKSPPWMSPPPKKSVATNYLAFTSHVIQEENQNLEWDKDHL